MHINWEKPNLNQQVHPASTFHLRFRLILSNTLQLTQICNQLLSLNHNLINYACFA